MPLCFAFCFGVLCVWFFLSFLYSFMDLAKSLNLFTSMTFHIISE